MKYLILAALVCSAVALPAPKQVEEYWSNFKSTFKKEYASEAEHAKRLTIFKNNLGKIESHNKLYEVGKVTYKMGVNHFSDWTSEEFMQYVNKGKLNVNHLNSNSTKLYRPPKNYRSPYEIDWREQNAVTEVKNQGSCGSCWAFSSTGAIESQHAVKHGELLLLSEQNLVDCSSYLGNAGCNGGWLDQAFDYVRENGIESEDAYPYEAVDADCRFDSAQSVLKIAGYTSIDSGNEGDLEIAVGDEGPVAAAVDVTDNFQQYSSGVFFDESCDSQSVNHGILIAGYSNDDGVDYWLVKNSWGPDWGDNGYIKIARKRDSHCAIAYAARFPTF